MPKVAYELPPLLRIYEDGRVERLMGTSTVPPSLDDPETHVQSKDVVFNPKEKLSSRVYLPKSDKKIPLLLYFHGGAFFIESAFSPTYHGYLNKIARAANVLIVSVDYRLAPEHPIPAPYEDAWTSLKWVASHRNGDGPEEWVNLYADLERVFIAGDSAGGNIAHNLTMRYGLEKIDGVNILGLVVVHPFFWGKDVLDGEVDGKRREVGDALWNLAYPNSGGLDNPVINPAFDPNLSKLGCKNVLIFVAEYDKLAKRGWLYYEKLKESGWKGNVEIVESKQEVHSFHIIDNPTCDNALALMNKFVNFLNRPSTRNSSKIKSKI